ncbi:hypothetical protein NDU88_000671 [Pleurodeles waltl]|uniref:Uncharacterized protein n=1 Tax=Pleurodeles waltl TaxID=8319 RepID=A0AAV7P4E2_PLEWA|nr:hypothetical protein NDU88_000671 [Pleurodeles waltl]
MVLSTSGGPSASPSVWNQLVSGPSVDRSISHRHRLAQEDPLFLHRHPAPLSFVVQTTLGIPDVAQIPPVLPHREARQLDAAGRCMFASSRATLRSINTSCVLAHFSHGLWDSVGHLFPSLHEDACTALMPLIRDSQQATRITVLTGMDTTDSVGRLMVGSIVIR